MEVRSQKIDTILRELGAKWSLMSVLQSSREESNVNQTGQIL